MKYFELPRRAGKTHILVDWVKKGSEISTFEGWSRVILVATLREKADIVSTYNLKENQVYSYAQWQDKLDKIFNRTAPYNIDIAIDNVDYVLQLLIGNNNKLNMVTFNKAE